MKKISCVEKSQIRARFKQKYTVGNKAKGRISKWMFQQNKARQISQKTNIFYPLISTRTCVKNVFLENLACFVFLKHSFWDSTFCLITNDTLCGSIFLRSKILHFVRIYFLKLTFSKCFTWITFPELIN